MRVWHSSPRPARRLRQLSRTFSIIYVWSMRGGNVDEVVNAGYEMSWNDRLNGAWQVQLGRVRRWYHRASSAVNPIDRADCIHAFFESAFHLRRWLEDTGQVSRIALLTLCETNEEMRICRD